MSEPDYFWCDECKGWTPMNNADGELFCSACGTDYTCGDCGCDIRRDGSCSNDECPQYGG